MGQHTKIEGALNGRLAQLRPGFPTKYQNILFEPPDSDAAILPQVLVFSFAGRVPAADDVFIITLNGQEYAASGASLSAALTNLAGLIVGAEYIASPPQIRVTGTVDGIPYTYAVVVETAGGVPIPAALGNPAITETQAAYISCAWLEAHLLPGKPTQATLGSDGLNLQTGVFQIDLHAPAGDGWGPGSLLVDIICHHFRRGTKLVHDGIEVTLMSVGPGPSYENGRWSTTPISVYYNAYVEND